MSVAIASRADSKVTAFLDALTAAGCSPRRSGGGWSARCPAHDDRSPSLSISVGQSQEVVLRCHAGCEHEAVLSMLGLDWSAVCREDRELGPLNGKALGEVVDRYVYTDENGRPLFRVNRFVPKTFRQDRYEGGRYISGLADTRRVLFRLPQTIAAVAAGQTVCVAEGEKDALALVRAGVAATTNPMGAGSWRHDYAEVLDGATVVIVAHREPAGYEHALTVARSLEKVGATVTIVEAAEGNDAHDHLSSGHGLDEFRPVTIEELQHRIETARGAAEPTATPTLRTVDRESDDGPCLPVGYTIWTATDRHPRPTPPPAMFAGPLGRFATEAAGYTEADPVAIFAQALTAVGVACNRSAYLVAGNDRHPAALFCLIVGASAKGGKGTAWAVVRDLITHVESGLLARVVGGFGSGEAIITELAPEDDKPVRDTRALVFESEFGGLLARGRREGSTVSAIMRDLWDGRPLQSRTRSGGKLVATDYHAGAIGHITRQELRAKLTEADLFGGFVNRWLIWYVERGQLQPDGGNVPDGLLRRTATELRSKLVAVRRGGAMARTPAATELWRDIYHQLADDDPPGLLGLALNRSAPQCLRLSVALALADGSTVITDDHVGSAYLIWQYCRASAAIVFGESAGSADADRLLLELREAGARGLDFTAQRDLFNRKTGRADNARKILEEGGYAITLKVATAGKPKSITYAVRATHL